MKVEDAESGIPPVCVVSSLYHRSLGGLGRQAVLLTERLAEMGVPLFVIGRRMKNTPNCYYDPNVRVIRINAGRAKVHILEDWSFANLVTSVRFSVGALWTLWTGRKEYEVVHFHGASIPLMVCIIALKFMKKKVIAKVAAANLGTEAGGLKDRYGPIGWLLRRLMLKVDLFVAISQEIYTGLLQDGIELNRIKRIPNFVDLGEFCPPSESEKKRRKKEMGLRDRSVVTFSGRLVSRKGVGVLINAWPPVVKECPSALLMVLGEGPDRGRLERMAADLGILKSIRFMGQVTDVAEYLKGSDIYAFPSFQEGFPNALLEAMACGLPPVASRIGGVEDVIKHHTNGYLVAAGDAAELGRRIIQLLQHPNEARKMGEAAARTIRENYSMDSIARQYAGMYREICQKEPDRV